MMRCNFSYVVVVLCVSFVVFSFVRSFFLWPGCRIAFIYDYFVGVAIVVVVVVVAVHVRRSPSNLDRYDFYMEFIDDFFHPQYSRAICVLKRTASIGFGEVRWHYCLTKMNKIKNETKIKPTTAQAEAKTTSSTAAAAAAAAMATPTKYEVERKKSDRII